MFRIKHLVKRVVILSLGVILFHYHWAYAISERFEITSKPTVSDWRFFMNASNDWKRELWDHYKRKDLDLKDWYWAWRIGWVKSCKHIKEAWCYKVLKQGLNDKALVVRAQAAESLGEKFANTRNRSIANRLMKEYKLKRNSRNSKPLFVKGKILFALKQILGSEHQDKIKKLASDHPEMVKYWERMQKSSS